MTAPKKTKKKTVLHFDAPTTEPERTHVLFTWGDKEFKTYESADISPFIMSITLEMLEENPLSAMNYAFKETFGEEAFAELTRLRLSPEQYKQITAVVMEHLASTFVEEEVEEQGKA